MTRLLIGLTGLRGIEPHFTQAQAGKDTVADHLVAEHDFMKIALADGVRESLAGIDPYVGPIDAELAKTHGLDPNTSRVSDLVAMLGWEQAKLMVPEMRRLQQTTGTDGGRLVHGDHLWLHLAARKINRLDPSMPVVVSDIRFPNEGSWVHRQGGKVVRVQRPDESVVAGSAAAHASESSWNDIEVDYVLDNDQTIEILHERIDRMVADLSKKA